MVGEVGMVGGKDTGGCWWGDFFVERLLVGFYLSFAGLALVGLGGLGLGLVAIGCYVRYWVVLGCPCLTGLDLSEHIIFHQIKLCEPQAEHPPSAPTPNSHPQPNPCSILAPTLPQPPTPAPNPNSALYPTPNRPYLR